MSVFSLNPTRQLYIISIIHLLQTGLSHCTLSIIVTPHISGRLFVIATGAYSVGQKNPPL
jgi:hypothetical protein